MIAALLALGALPGSTAHADEVRVVASIKPVHSLVAGIMQGAGEPTLLVKGAASPHTYSLRPSEAQALADADVVFWIGEGLETFLIKPLEALSPRARVVELAASDGLTLLAAREGGIWQAHAHESAGEMEHAGEHAEHAADHQGEPAHGALDMHLWLDPHNAEALVERIESALSEADPGNADVYAGNAGDLRQRLAELDEALRDRLEPVRDRPFVVFHDAYHYFEHRYGLHAAGSITINPERRPGAERLSQIHARLEELGAACVFTEPQFEPSLVRTVVEGTSARIGTLDPLGASLDAGADQYFELMNGLADSMVDCLADARSG